MLWCKTRVRNLSPAGFQTSTPAPTWLVVRPFHRIFSSFHLYIYILYIGNEDFLRRLWRCGGFLEDWHDHGANTLACLSDEDGGRRRGAVREGEKGGKGRDERHLSISFNPTFPCRLLLSIYYKLFCRSPRGAACPADGENTRAFHSIKFDKVRRRCTEVPEGISRYRESKMARVSSIPVSISMTRLPYYSRDRDSFQNLSIVHRVPLF